MCPEGWSLDLSHATWVIVNSYLKGIYGTKKYLFYGIEEHRMAPNELFGDQLLQKLENGPNLPFGKDEEKKRENARREWVELKEDLFIYLFLICFIGQHWNLAQFGCHEYWEEHM